MRLCRLRKSPVTMLTSPDLRREVVMAPPRLPRLTLSRSVRFTKRFFATVFLGSGLLFVATAVAGGLFASASRSSGPPGGDVLALGRDVTGLW